VGEGRTSTEGDTDANFQTRHQQTAELENRSQNKSGKWGRRTVAITNVMLLKRSPGKRSPRNIMGVGKLGRGVVGGEAGEGGKKKKNGETQTQSGVGKSHGRLSPSP